MPLLRLLPFPLAALAVVFLLPDTFPPKDFTEYWSAARVLASGGDPYNGADLLPVQREATGDPALTTAVSLWTPPWTLPLYLPLGWLPFGVARWVWLAAQLLMLFAAVDWLWRTYTPLPVGERSVAKQPGEGSGPAERPSPAVPRSAGPATSPQRGEVGVVGSSPTATSSHRVDPARSWWLPHLVAFLFAPTFWMVHYGQNTGFLVFGLAGFLRFRNTRPTLAGCFAALTAVKPHLLAVVGVLLVLDAFRDRGWRVLVGGVFTLAVGSAVALAVNGHIFEWLVAGTLHPSPEAIPLHKWQLPLIAFQIRHALAPNSFWVQFVPCGVACGLMAVHYLLNRRRWNWGEQLPGAVAVSCLFAPYGGWMFDLVVLLVPTVQLVARAKGLVGWALVGAVAAVNLVAIQPIHLHDFGWYAPLMCGLWAAGVVVLASGGRQPSGSANPPGG